MTTGTKQTASDLTDAIASAAKPQATLEDIYEWIGQREEAQYAEVQREAVIRDRVPEGAPRELYLGRKAVDLMAKIIERKDEVLFLLKAPPRHERRRPR